mmetsp:Transcript_34008/g.55191  ORF Transcript_34008/g.55191 Transcript_34008/m.55191 type:complete len:585 (+) Transcript_34008:94-1848(+)
MSDKKYRFDVGTAVQCRVDSGWKAGVIVKINYKEPGWEKSVPYQVKLSSGPLIYVPVDSPELCIKADNESTPQGMRLKILKFSHPAISESTMSASAAQKELEKLGWVADETDQKGAVEAMKKLPAKAWSLFAVKAMYELAGGKNGGAAADAGRALVLLERASDFEKKNECVAHVLAVRAFALVDFMAPKAASVDAAKANELHPSKLYKNLFNHTKELAAFVEMREGQRKLVEKTKVPVTVLTGFLGSGKTTLLNYILTEQKQRKYAVIENEFGSVGVDDQLVRNKFKDDEDVVEMNNGCICCTVRGDLIKTLKRIQKLIAGGKKLDGVIIETTGMADPAPVAQTFFADDDVASAFRIDGIITVVDCKWIVERLKEEKQGENEAVEQVAFADVLLLNKTDLVDKKRLEEVKKQVRVLNGEAKMIETKYSRVDLAEVMDIGGFSLDKVLQKDEEFVNFDQEHEHDNSVSSCGFTLDGELDMGRFNKFIQKMMVEKGVDLYRSKGVVAIEGMAKKFVFQAVHMLFGGEPTVNWKRGEKRVSRFVFIGKNLNPEEIKKDAEACIAKSSDQAAAEEQFAFAGSGDGYKA